MRVKEMSIAPSVVPAARCLGASIGMPTPGTVGHAASALIRFADDRLTAWHGREPGLGRGSP